MVDTNLSRKTALIVCIAVLRAGCSLHKWRYSSKTKENQCLRMFCDVARKSFREVEHLFHKNSECVHLQSGMSVHLGLE